MESITSSGIVKSTAEETGLTNQQEDFSPPLLPNTPLFSQEPLRDVSPAFSIVESQLPLGNNFAGHNMLVLLNSEKQVCTEIHGLATDQNGAVKPVGWPPDRLQCHFFDRRYLYEQNQAQACLINGSHEELKKRIDAAREAGRLINEQNLPYPLFGVGKNSNSMASTLIRVMNLQEPERLPGGAKFLPGQGTMLLDEVAIGEIQRQFNVNTVSEAEIMGLT
jgi:hypothetical protein